MTKLEDRHEGIEHRIRLLQSILPHAVSIIKDAYAQPRSIVHKGVVDIVTETDLAVEQCLVHAIRQRFANDAVLAEESGERKTKSSYLWIIDPIDGTTNFGNGLPHFCISVALQLDERTVYGSILDPMKGHHFEATLGRGAQLNGAPIRTSALDNLDQALLATGFSYDRRERVDNNVAEFDSLLRQCRGIRRMGAAALDLAYVAAGWIDGYWEYRLHPWDIAAGLLLVTEAGGIATTLDGRTATPFDPHICAAGTDIHQSLLQAVQTSPRKIIPAPIGD